ncbi:N-formylglutamate amidohydrolase (plasmid) [Aminobacter sp. SR38]|jgi:predicted N-formylglutamate amidohydrolase|nr:N-formylglutamate amidohydrolase [Aminobacter sp. SR38]
MPRTDLDSRFPKSPLWSQAQPLQHPLLRDDGEPSNPSAHFDDVNKPVSTKDPDGSPAGWTIKLGDSPVVGTAIHNGTDVSAACRSLMCLPDPERLREEDPFTEHFIADFPTQIIVHRSRFQVDLNRAREAAIYLSPEQSWGLKVWGQPPSEDVVTEALAFHDAYYAELKRVLSAIENRHGRFVLIDVHSYNHRRAGPEAVPAAQEEAPDINIGTFSMDRKRWAPIVDSFIETLRGHTLDGEPIDIRENVSFQGKGEQTRFVHANFPGSGCAIAVEFKKVFMDEWSGEPDRATIDRLRSMLASTVPVLEAALRGMG